MTKKNILWGSGIGGGLFVFFLLALLYNFCGSYRNICKDVYGLIVYPFSVLPFVFLLSLITYKMRDEVFQAWWSFARWFVPLIIVVTFLLYRNGESGGAGMTGIGSGVGESFILLVLYVLFIITSLARIILTYRRSK
jgi:hypothetical protein